MGVKVDSASGKIITNNEQTSVSNIYAVGDVLLVSLCLKTKSTKNFSFLILNMLL